MTFCHHTSYCVVDNSVDNLLITSLIFHMGHSVSLRVFYLFDTYYYTAEKENRHLNECRFVGCIFNNSDSLFVLYILYHIDVISCSEGLHSGSEIIGYLSACRFMCVPVFEPVL